MITTGTTIGQLLDEHPELVTFLASYHPHFEKLRFGLLRKVMALRVTVELGLVYDVDVQGGAVTVTMTLTAPGCPIHDVMPRWVNDAVAKIPGVERVEVAITFDPPWTPDRIARA